MGNKNKNIVVMLEYVLWRLCVWCVRWEYEVFKGFENKSYD